MSANRPIRLISVARGFSNGLLARIRSSTHDQLDATENRIWKSRRGGTWGKRVQIGDDVGAGPKACLHVVAR